MTQERPGSTARGPQHVMMKLQIYNTSPHFGKGIVSIMMLVRQGSSLRAACAQMGLSYSKAWPGRPCLRRLKSISRPTTRSRNKHAKRQCRAALPF